MRFLLAAEFEIDSASVDDVLSNLRAEARARLRILLAG
jgi:hypothetical protein